MTITFIFLFLFKWTWHTDFYFQHCSADALRRGSSGGDVGQEEAHQTNFQWASDICSGENLRADKVLGRTWESEAGLFSGHDRVTSQGKQTPCRHLLLLIVPMCIMVCTTNKVTLKCSCVFVFSAFVRTGGMTPANVCHRWKGSACSIGVKFCSQGSTCTATAHVRLIHYITRMLRASIRTGCTLKDMIMTSLFWVFFFFRFIFGLAYDFYWHFIHLFIDLF